VTRLLLSAEPYDATARGIYDSVVKRLGVVVPMEPELRPFAKRVRLQREEVDGRVVHSGTIGDVEIKATITTMGTTPAKASTEFVLDTLDVDHVVLIGIAGGLGPDVHIGDLLVPEVVIDYDTRRETHPTPLGQHVAAGTLMTSGELILDPDILSRLADDGAAAIDMETSAVGAACEDRGVPWSVFRGISDHIRDSLIDSGVSNLAKPDGSADVGAVVKFLVTKPWRIPTLAKLGRDMNTAAKAAAGALVDSL
jgi:adenosylhomocysteine nucleosidase